MKKIAFWSYYENFAKNNYIFDKECFWYNKLFYKYSRLQSELLQKGYAIEPLNTVSLDDVACFLCYDRPRNSPKIDYIFKNKKIKKILIIEECNELRPENWDLNYHNNFDLVLTWSDALIKLNPKKYVKIYLTNLCLSSIPFSVNKVRPGKVVLLNSNKKLKSPHELYTLRSEIVTKLQDDLSFDLYGNDWDRLVFNMNGNFSFLNSQKFSNIFRLLSKAPKRWKGHAEDKDQILLNYDFSFAIENVQNQLDYVTEKITDSMIAGAIPVYLGAKNIEMYFPKNTFIDFKRYDGLESLLESIKSMSQDDIIDYRKNINTFLRSEHAKKYTGDSFASTVAGLL